MTINRVTLAGFAGKDAKSSTTHSGRSVTKLSIATTKRYKDVEGNWQEKTQWHNCVAFGSTADYAAKTQTGSYVFIEGELVYREYERTLESETGCVKIQWPITEIIIESVSVIDRKEKERPGAA